MNFWQSFDWIMHLCYHEIWDSAIYTKNHKINDQDNDDVLKKEKIQRYSRSIFCKNFVIITESRLRLLSDNPTATFTNNSFMKILIYMFINEIRFTMILTFFFNKKVLSKSTGYPYLIRSYLSKCCIWLFVLLIALEEEKFWRISILLC